MFSPNSIAYVVMSLAIALLAGWFISDLIAAVHKAWQKFETTQYADTEKHVPTLDVRRVELLDATLRWMSQAVTHLDAKASEEEIRALGTEIRADFSGQDLDLLSEAMAVTRPEFVSASYNRGVSPRLYSAYRSIIRTAITGGTSSFFVLVQLS